MKRNDLRNTVKEKYLSMLTDFFKGKGEDTLRVGSNEIAFPIVDSEGNEDFIVVKVSIPTGSRDGEPYDAYLVSQDYALKCAQKAEKKAEQERKKQVKIERDKKMREAKAANKAKREVQPHAFFFMHTECIIMRPGATKIFEKKFEKPLDKSRNLWYNECTETKGIE